MSCFFKLPLECEVAGFRRNENSALTRAKGGGKEVYGKNVLSTKGKCGGLQFFSDCMKETFNAVRGKGRGTQGQKASHPSIHYNATYHRGFAGAEEVRKQGSGSGTGGLASKKTGGGKCNDKLKRE